MNQNFKKTEFDAFDQCIPNKKQKTLHSKIKNLRIPSAIPGIFSRSKSRGLCPCHPSKLKWTSHEVICFKRLQHHHTCSAGPFQYLLHQTDHSVLPNPPQTLIPACPPPQLTLLYSLGMKKEWGNNPWLLSWSDPRGCLSQKKEMTCQYHSYTNIKVQTGLIGQICELAVSHRSQYKGADIPQMTWTFHEGLFTFNKADMPLHRASP